LVIESLIIEITMSLLLKIYARLERPLLMLNFRIVNSPLVRWPILRSILWLLFFKPMSELGAAGQPLTLKEVEAFIRRAEKDGRIAVGPCGCRTVHGRCSHPIRTDIVVYGGVMAWAEVFPEDYEIIEAEEAIEITKECNAQGMIQVLYRSGMGGGKGFVICNCCKDGCLPLLNRKFYHSYRFHRGNYVASVEPDQCELCGRCEELCPFDARNKRGRPEVDDCYGCGLCAEHCPYGAVKMVLRG
jgi:NAD-dependent dihydropyrimidine dehydrogenase PreA subunit